jgi:hypothetical protein
MGRKTKPKKKNQHYVPRFYLKNFSDGDKRTINLFNLKNRESHAGASLKSQCYEPYFYDKEGGIEGVLEWLEDKATKIIKNIILTEALPDKTTQEFGVLLLYITTQDLRTKNAVTEIHELSNKMEESVCRENPDSDLQVIENYCKMLKEHTVPILLLTAADVVPMVYDLKIKLIRNESREPFITRDNPVAHYNQYMEPLSKRSYTAMFAHGLQLFVPISPRLLLHLYDSSVYLVGKKNTQLIEISSEEEALKLNELQWMNALDHIYFPNLSEFSSIQIQAKRFLQRRRSSQFDLDL